MAAGMTEPTTPLMQQYHSIKRRHPHALLLFRLGDFYELFYEDAIVASRQLQITLTSRNREKGQSVPMCGVPYHAAEHYIARLIRAGHKVAICEQMEDPSRTKKLVRREVIRVLTPGTATDSPTLEMRENNFLAAIARNGVGKPIGLAFVDFPATLWSIPEHCGRHRNASRTVGLRAGPFRTPAHPAFSRRHSRWLRPRRPFAGRFRRRRTAPLFTRNFCDRGFRFRQRNRRNASASARPRPRAPGPHLLLRAAGRAGSRQCHRPQSRTSAARRRRRILGHVALFSRPHGNWYGRAPFALLDFAPFDGSHGNRVPPRRRRRIEIRYRRARPNARRPRRNFRPRTPHQPRHSRQRNAARPPGAAPLPRSDSAFARAPREISKRAPRATPFSA